MKSPSYEDAIRWISKNAAADADVDAVMVLQCVIMTAELFDVAFEIVAQEVLIARASATT